MPSPIVGPGMVTSPTGNGVIVIGGAQHFMLKLSDSMQWTKLKHLNYVHNYPLVVPIPDDTYKLCFEKGL